MHSPPTSESIRLQKYANERRQSLLNSLAYMKDANFLTDVTLLCDGQSYPAHRVTLAASSAYFRDIFQHKQKVSRINVHDIDHETFQAVLDFLYTGKLRLEAVQGVKLAKVLSAFTGLNVHCLDNITSCVLVNVLNTRNYFAMWDMVKELKLRDAENTVVKYVASNLKECCQNQNFTLLSLQQMVSVLSSKHLTAESGGLILEAVSTWGSYQHERRAKYLTSLLSVVGLNPDPSICKELMCFERVLPLAQYRTEFSETKSDRKGAKSEQVLDKKPVKLEHPSPSDITVRGKIDRILGKLKSPRSDLSIKKQEEHDLDVICETQSRPNKRQKWKTPEKKSDEPIITKETELRSPRSLKSGETFLVNDSNDLPKWTRNDSNNLPKWTRKSTKGAVGCESILCLGCDRFGMPTQRCFYPTSKHWSVAKQSIKFSSAKTSTIYHDGFIYAIGGEAENGDKIATTVAYNIATQILKKVSSMTLARSEIGVAQLFGCIYAIGGRGSTQKPVSQVEFYCPPADIWRNVASLRRARMQPSVTSADTIIYVVGGSFSNEFHVDTTCEYYDQTVNQWTAMASLPKSFAESHVMVTCHKERMYAIQCLKPEKLTHYLTRQNKWVELDSCTSVCRVVAFLSCNNLIWVLDRSGKFFTYDDVAKKWSIGTKIPADLTWPLVVHCIEGSI